MIIRTQCCALPLRNYVLCIPRDISINIEEEIPNSLSGHKFLHAFYWQLRHPFEKRNSILTYPGLSKSNLQFQYWCFFIFPPPEISFFCTFIPYTCFLVALHQFLVHSIIIYFPFPSSACFPPKCLHFVLFIYWHSSQHEHTLRLLRHALEIQRDLLPFIDLLHVKSLRPSCPCCYLRIFS